VSTDHLLLGRVAPTMLNSKWRLNLALIYTVVQKTVTLFHFTIHVVSTNADQFI